MKASVHFKKVFFIFLSILSILIISPQESKAHCSRIKAGKPGEAVLIRSGETDELVDDFQNVHHVYVMVNMYPSLFEDKSDEMKIPATLRVNNLIQLAKKSLEKEVMPCVKVGKIEEFDNKFDDPMLRDSGSLVATIAVSFLNIDTNKKTINVQQDSPNVAEIEVNLYRHATITKSGFAHKLTKFVFLDTPEIEIEKEIENYMDARFKLKWKFSGWK